jgi:hypothetical protein
MDTAALVAWIVASVLGLALALAFLLRGGPGDSIDAVRDRTVARMPGGYTEHDAPAITPGLIIGHGLLALVALGLLIGWVSDRDGDAWSHAGWGIFTFAVATVGLGAVMFGSWLRPEHQRSKAVRSMPPAGVYLHGLAGVAAVVLLIAAAIAQ